MSRAGGSQSTASRKYLGKFRGVPHIEEVLLYIPHTDHILHHPAQVIELSHRG